MVLSDNNSDRLAPVSVVMPAYNCGRYIEEALDSVLAQTRLPAQIIVVDDGSKDDTGRRVERYRDRVEYVRQENAGVSATRNRGVALANQEFVAFLDGDDVWHPLKTELQLEAFRANPDLGTLSTPTYDWPGTTPEVGWAVPPVRLLSWEEMVVKNRMNTSSVMVRRGLLQQVGPFDTGMQGPEDKDLWLRLVEAAPGGTFDVALSGYRITPGGISQNPERCQAGMLRILEKIDRRGAWGKRWLTRRRAYSYLNHACSSIYTDAGRHGAALGCEIKSLLWYPAPYDRSLTVTSFERAKRLAVVTLRLLRGRQKTEKGTGAAPAVRSIPS